MGNTLVSPCFCSMIPKEIKLIFWEGTTRVLTGRHVAGEIMFEFPEMMVCHADSFFIGRPIPALAIEDCLVPGETYFVLPIDCLPCTGVLSAASLATLGSNSPSNGNNNNTKPKSPMNFGQNQPFQYIKGDNGRLMIKVVPEFITRLIARPEEDLNSGSTSPCNGLLCSTPELQKHYSQLVGTPKEQIWSPKLETISEHKLRFSPCRFIGLEWKQKE